MRLLPLLLLGVVATVSSAAPQAISPGDVWPDDRGQHIQAHGGGIIRLGELAHWTFRNQVMKQADPGDLGPRFVLERPKVFFTTRSDRR